MTNPDIPVKLPEHFYGRKSIVRRIFSRIGAERPQSIALIGSRKSGKTSLLYYLNDEQVRSKHLESSEKYLFFLLNSRNCMEKQAENFIREITRQITSSTNEEKNYYNALQKNVREIHSQGKKIILLFDDFHLITGSEHYPLEFFSFLRSLANNYNVAYVTTSYLELQKLCVAKDIQESPFFNIFTNLSIGPFSLKEGIRLLSVLTGTEEETAEKIVTWAGPLPYTLKLIARNCAEEIRSKNLPESRYEKKLLPILAPYFGQILSLLTKEAFMPLKQLAKEKKPDQKAEYLLRPLIRHGFLIEQDDEMIRPFSPAFLLFLKTQLSAKILKGHECYNDN
ncbi:MAG: ATP-binding protein [Spirochaetales bacterium]|nr:ATP-binding protein [Spirochaetales bacterium]